MVRRIPVGAFPHYYAIVDDEDFEYLSQFSWSNNEQRNTVYAVTKVNDAGKFSRGRGTEQVSMHKLITGYEQTDHRNGIGLDNRRENLRDGSGWRNKANSKKQRTHSGAPTSSKFKGVSWNNGWDARITHHGKTIFLGRYSSEVEAALTYDTAARQRFGEFARLNFPDSLEQGAVNAQQATFGTDRCNESS